MSLADFKVQAGTSLTVADAMALIEREFGRGLLELGGYKLASHTTNQLTYTRRRSGREWAAAGVAGVVGGALEALGPVGAITGDAVAFGGLSWNTSERIIFTATSGSAGTAVDVRGRAELRPRQLVDLVTSSLKGARPAAAQCARCGCASGGSVWCPACCAELDRCKVDPAAESALTRAVGRMQTLMASGSTDGFFEVFAADVVVTKPAEGLRMSRAQFEARLERILPVQQGCTVKVAAMFLDGATAWVVTATTFAGGAARGVARLGLNEEARIALLEDHDA